MMRQVIIGNGAAAISAIKAIREVDRSCQIVLISAEDCRAYSPALLKYYIGGRIGRESVFLVSPDFYQKHNVETVPGNEAVGLDASKGIVYLSKARNVKYDNLLIATGSRPAATAGLTGKSVNAFSLKTLRDADELVRLSGSDREIAILGGGLAGLETASVLFEKRGTFMLLVSSGQVLSRSVDATCAAIIHRKLESLGLPFSLGEGVVAVEKGGGRVVVEGASGRRWSVDALVVAKGFLPNIGLVLGSGVGVHEGVLVDEFMRTGAGNIFAAGDVAEARNVISGVREVMPNLVNAFKQGRVAGLNMAGANEKYAGGIRENVTTIFEIPLAIMGLSEAQVGAQTARLVFNEPGREIYRKILVGGHRLVGATLLGKVEDAGILRNLMVNQGDISPWQDRIVRGCYDLREILFPLARV